MVGLPIPRGATRVRALRIFLLAWAVYALHFATNIEREHYPAFTLVDHATFRTDEYLGFHDDIFLHTDGHAVVGNNVATSLFAAGPLFVFDPFLDAIEAYSLRRLEAEKERGKPEPEYKIYEHRPNARAFFKLAHDRGLDVRFGAVTAVTTGFFMAPMSALCVALMFLMLVARGVDTSRATAFALLFGFATPIWFRTSALNHNLVVMYATFGSFVCMWPRRDNFAPLSVGVRLAAGFLAGWAFASDYSGVIPLLCLYGYLVCREVPRAGWVGSVRESLWFVAGSVPPVLFLWYSQWSMYGNPFFPGQYWMPEVSYTDRGWRGFSFPTVDLFFLNLFDEEYGMYAFGPLLALGLVPTWWYAEHRLVLPRTERRFVAAYVLAFMVFCAANQYSRMQFNTGFRYFMPLVPLIFLQLSDHLLRLPKAVLVVLAAGALLNSWAIASIRESVTFSWHMFVEHGPQLPWLAVIRMTQPADSFLGGNPLVPIAVIGTSAVVLYALWRSSARWEDTVS